MHALCNTQQLQTAILWQPEDSTYVLRQTATEQPLVGREGRGGGGRGGVSTYINMPFMLES